MSPAINHTSSGSVFMGGFGGPIRYEFGEPGLFSAARLTDFHRKPGTSTWEYENENMRIVDPSEEELDRASLNLVI